MNCGGPAMPTKNITTDEEAYGLLAAEKRGGESFSDVIKRRWKPRKTARALLEHLREYTLAEDTLDRVEEIPRSGADDIDEPPIPDFEE